MGRLTGQVALITGGSRGFGRATAWLLARHGADVALNYRAAATDAESIAGEIRQLGRRVEVLQGDVAHAEQADALADRALDAFGGIDILVNNAGVLDIAAFLDQCPATWRTMIDVNVYGTVALTHRLLPQMVERGRGRVINLASQLAHVGGENFAVYAGTKAFVLAFSKSLAREVGPSGITVNAVCPGSIVTDMNLGLFTPEEQAAKADSLPLRHLGDPDDVAEAVLYLASESGRFVTGQCIDVNGGNIMA